MTQEHAFVRFEREDPCRCDSLLETCPRVLDILVYSLGDVRRALEEYPCMHLKKLGPTLAPPQGFAVPVDLKPGETPV